MLFTQALAVAESKALACGVTSGHPYSQYGSSFNLLSIASAQLFFSACAAPSSNGLKVAPCMYCSQEMECQVGFGPLLHNGPLNSSELAPCLPLHPIFHAIES